MKKKLIYLLAAVTLAAAVCGVKPTRSGAAPFDPDTKGSLKVYPMKVTDENADMATDLKSAEARVDIYLVAEAVKMPGYDTYQYKATSDFQAMSESIEKETEKAEDWEAMAQEAAKIVFEPNSSAKVSATGKVDGETAVSNLTPGLYLLLARGGVGTDRVADFRKDVTDDEGNPIIATYANSAQYEYTFKPQLISLPMRDSEVPVNPPVPPNTADRGDWAYDLDVYLKPERSVRYGSLTIRKVLSSYESEADLPNDPVTFVFQVDGETEGTSGNGGVLPSYHAVDSLTFTSAGEDTVTFEKIPVTLKLTVSEVYGGSGYEIAPDTGGVIRENIEITADETQVVEIPFINVHNDDLKRGHGIKNQFTYAPANPDDPASGGAWDWESEPSQNQ